jgi:hypothetical protein
VEDVLYLKERPPSLADATFSSLRSLECRIQDHYVARPND